MKEYLWCTISWNVGSGHDRFDRKEWIMSLFRWGFPLKLFQYWTLDIKSGQIFIVHVLFLVRGAYHESTYF
ncbi:Photosystem I assembly protein Ycf4 [Dendrobium catenatum]|uniref:Photosystem I assembly protein Ycf4 n=1 Tax=Dendrobium catenatum TaxID=906689 RepID=A0A2I0VZI7_9ASPA|nr:Photosystem I assembly protein Ycf4 [Dendrobium catenatum]